MESKPAAQKHTFSSGHCCCSPRKTKKKRGVKARNKFRAHKPVLPSFIFGNVRSIGNKTDELHGLIQNERIFKTASFLSFTESWLEQNMDTSLFNMTGFKLLRADRQDCSEKNGGGGIINYLNTQWCHPNNCHEILKSCNPSLEMFTINATPYYLPREFTSVLVTTVYIDCHANKSDVISEITNHIQNLETKYPDALQIINGDFNKCSLDSDITNWYQYVSCDTRVDPVTGKSSKLDLFYSNINNAYVCSHL